MLKPAKGLLFPGYTAANKLPHSTNWVGRRTTSRSCHCYETHTSLDGQLFNVLPVLMTCNLKRQVIIPTQCSKLPTAAPRGCLYSAGKRSYCIDI